MRFLSQVPFHIFRAVTRDYCLNMWFVCLGFFWFGFVFFFVLFSTRANVFSCVTRLRQRAHKRKKHIPYSGPRPSCISCEMCSLHHLLGEHLVPHILRRLLSRFLTSGKIQHLINFNSTCGPVTPKPFWISLQQMSMKQQKAMLVTKAEFNKHWYKMAVFDPTNVTVKYIPLLLYFMPSAPSTTLSTYWAGISSLVKKWCILLPLAVKESIR